MTEKRTKKNWIKMLLIVALAGAVLALVIDLVVVLGTGSRVSGYGEEVRTDALGGEADCILVLGCGIKDDNTPSDMLHDRLETGIELYERGFAPRILISGDNGQIGYNEIHVMLHYLLDHGIAAEDIFCDHAGFSTYDSIYRAASIFGAERIIVVSQKYHLYRALHIAKVRGIDAIGAGADIRSYRGQSYREIREILARDKDFVKALLNFGPTYGGEMIPLDGDSRASWEESEK